MSDDDIRKGQLWRTTIGNQLGDTNFGVVFVSAANQHAPWLNFESGALAKHVELASVAPILLDLSDSDLDGPLQHFHTTKPNRDDLLKLVQSINEAAEDSQQRDVTQVEHVFDGFWPDLEEALTKAMEDLKAEPTNIAEPARGFDEVLDELLVLSRGQSRMIANLASASVPMLLGDATLRVADVNHRAQMEANNILGEKCHATLAGFPGLTIWLKEGASIDADEAHRLSEMLSLLGFTDIKVHPDLAHT